MGTGEKKIKQSILSIALFLLLCGYYSAHQPPNDKEIKNEEEKIESLHSGSEDKMNGDNIFCNDIENKKIADS